MPFFLFHHHAQVHHLEHCPNCQILFWVVVCLHNELNFSQRSPGISKVVIKINLSVFSPVLTIRILVSASEREREIQLGLMAHAYHTTARNSIRNSRSSLTSYWVQGQHDKHDTVSKKKRKIKRNQPGPVTHTTLRRKRQEDQKVRV